MDDITLQIILNKDENDTTSDTAKLSQRNILKPSSRGITGLY